MVSCSSAGVATQPVAVISITGEHPLHDLVAVKFGSVISLCPSGSPTWVAAGGIGLKPWSVDCITGVSVALPCAELTGGALVSTGVEGSSPESEDSKSVVGSEPESAGTEGMSPSPEPLGGTGT